jgi:nicotinamide phosphoribosyltransferase
MAHLINFQGSDTGLGIIGARLWYDCHMAGYSIPASEHATITSWGLDTKGETAAFRNMIKAFGKSAIFACVSDGNDIEKATGEIWGTALYDEVMAMNATLVIRPDSGDPIEWLPKLLRILDAKFGSVKNSKGYKVLNKVRLIQGDGVTIKSLPLMIKAILDAGFSLDNVAFGMGGGLLQKVDRDTFKWAMKCCAIRINGEWKEVFKDPATDPGKKSKRGFPALYRNKETGEYKTLAGLQHEHPGVDWEGILQPIYRHSRILPQPMIHRIKFSEMRYNASLKLNL